MFLGSKNNTLFRTVIKKVVARPICPLLGTNFVEKWQIGPSSPHFYLKCLYRHMVLHLDIQNTT